LQQGSAKIIKPHGDARVRQALKRVHRLFPIFAYMLPEN
jgi:hypothetical protein